MPTMKDSRILFTAAGGGDPTDDIAEFGEEVEILDRKEAWSKIKLVEGDLEPEGWVPTETIDETGAAGNAGGPIDKTEFAKECWLQAIYFGSNAHFLAIVAEMRSSTRDDVAGNQVGPYRFTADQWKNAASDPEYDIRFAPKNIGNWRIQCVVGALVTQRARKVLETANTEVTAISLFNEWLKQIGETPAADQVQLGKDMQVAIDATKKPYADAGNTLIDATIAPIAAPAAPAMPGPAAPLPGAGGAVGTLLDFMGHVEAPLGYNQMFGERTTTHNNLVGMTINQILAFQQQFTNGGKASSAAGKYQIIHQTLAGLKTSMRLSGTELFDGPMQDKLATKLLVDRGLNKRLANAISKEAFANQLAMEWASMPVVTAIRGQRGFMLKPGQSYYAGDGLNKALVAVVDFLKAVP